MKIDSVHELPNNLRIASANVDNTACEIMIDRDGRIRRGKCLCGYYRKFALKNGPCRHMMAIRWRMTAPPPL
jgi:hypothetical protein